MIIIQHLIFISVGYDVFYNRYKWLRPPHIHEDINLDNHEVNIEHYNFTYTSGEGNSIESNLLSIIHQCQSLFSQYFMQNIKCLLGEDFPGLGVKINLKRHIGFHLTLTYIPSMIFVLVAWLSFLVPSDIVPGRMVLCVTTLLTLTSMFNSVR